jgi:hypothetical protein
MQADLPIVILLKEELPNMNVHVQNSDYKELLIKAISAKESDYDPQICMLRRPFHSPGYHTSLTAQDHPTIHPTYHSLLYAVGLLNTEIAEYEERACDIIGRVLTLQDRERSHDTYGIWPWFYEEPLAQMAPPDWNWADFCGKELLLAMLRHGHKLPESLKRQIHEAVCCACDAIIKRDVGPHYTNIAIMGAFVTLIAGELYERKDFADYGLDRLEKLQRYSVKLGTFQEFNSPAYSIIAIVELSKIHTYSTHPRAKSIATELLDLVWRMVAEHYHPSSRQWAGPHSRSYSTLLNNRALSFLQIATSNQIVFLNQWDLEYDSEWFGNGIQCPEPYVQLFTRKKKSDLSQIYYRNEETGFVKWADTFLTPTYTIGVFRHEIMWNQTRGMVAYFDNGEHSTYLQMRCLHDGYDYCSAVLQTAASSSQLLLGVNFLTNGGDTHPNLDRIQGNIAATDFRIRMEFGGCLERVRLEKQGAKAQVIIDEMVLRFESVYAVFEESEETRSPCEEELSSSLAGWDWEISKEGDIYGLDLIIHRGEKRTIDFMALNKAAFLFSLSIGDLEGLHPQITLLEEADQVTARYVDDIVDRATQQLSISLKPNDKHPN